MQRFLVASCGCEYSIRNDNDATIEEIPVPFFQIMDKTESLQVQTSRVFKKTERSLSDSISWYFKKAIFQNGEFRYRNICDS